MVIKYYPEGVDIVVIMCIIYINGIVVAKALMNFSLSLMT